ncbi:MAG: DUF2927 domain-containing protein [Rhodoferax sp.]|jgi:hypothetical protein|nr:DUF2927 domain-containing protein [Rhodoferax sp.]
MRRAAVSLLLCAWSLLAAPMVLADELQDRFDTVWESLWYQGGTPVLVARWAGDIRVRVQGRNVSTHRERIIEALRRVARETDIEIVDVTDGGASAAPPNLEVKLVNDGEGPPNTACFVRTTERDGQVIKAQELSMRQGAVYHCALHEAMHVMGISGHPRAGTVLSYFHQRSDQLTDMDVLMLRAWYSHAMKPGMTPLEALPVLTDSVVAAAGPDNALPARAAQRRFHADVIRQMEGFAGGDGEVPVVIKRSGTASADMMQRGRQWMALFLGMAYARGGIVAQDPTQAVRWTERAAREGIPFARWLMGGYARRGYGRAADAADAYVWYSLAAAQGVQPAAEAVKLVASAMTAEQIEAANKRVAAFR